MRLELEELSTALEFDVPEYRRVRDVRLGKKSSDGSRFMKDERVRAGQ